MTDQITQPDLDDVCYKYKYEFRYLPFVSTCCAWHLAEDIHDGFYEGDFVLHGAVAALNELVGFGEF